MDSTRLCRAYHSFLESCSQCVRGPALLENQGGRQSSNNTTGSFVWTPTSKLVLTARGGYSFLNEKLGNYGIPAVTGQLRQIVQATADGPAPAGFGLAAGTQNFPSFANTLFDVSRRRTFDADASYLVSDFGGRHAFKGGVQFNGISNDLQSTTVDTVVFRFGPVETIANLTGHSDVPTSPASSVQAGCNVSVLLAMREVITWPSISRIPGSQSAG